MSHAATEIKVSRDDARWEVEVKAQIPADALARYREEELKELQKSAKLDGFRPGKAPLERIVQTYGEPAIARLTAERAIQHELPEILAAEKVLIVETPRVQSDDPVRQLAEGKPLSFTACAGLAPEIQLPDWKVLAKKHNEKRGEITITDEEHAQALTHLKRERARIEKLQEGVEARAAAEAARAIAEGELPPLDDAFAQSIGYESAEKFTSAVRANMQSEKEARAREAKRTAILDDILQESTIRYPAMLRQYELEDMEGRISEDLARMGSSFDNYMAEVKKTREQLRKEWEEPADKRAKIRLILTEIARQERVDPEESKLKHELEQVKKLYPATDEANLRAGIAHALRNEKVMELLEKQS